MHPVSTIDRDSPPPQADLAAVKSRQRDVWSSGDYAVIGTTLQIVGELLCEALDLRSTARVLDVAAGNGNVTLAAARRFCEVTATDYVPALLANAQQRAQGEGLAIAIQEADAEALPFPDEAFDAVVSTFGVMFTPDQERAASEMLRVCRRGGKIGLANWTPEGFIGQLFKVVGKYVPPPAVKPPSLWGRRERIAQLFGAAATGIQIEAREFAFRYRSPEHWLSVFETFYGPVLKAVSKLQSEERAALECDILKLIAQFNKAEDGTMVVPGEYLEIVVTRS